MEDLVKQITSELSAAHNVLLGIVRHEDVSIEVKVSLCDFFKKHERVSDLVAYIEDNPTDISDIVMLSDTCSRFIQFYNENATVLSSFNAQEDTNTYLAPYKKEVDVEGKAWARLDTLMKRISNRMDSIMDMESERFVMLDKAYDRIQGLRDLHRSNQNKAYKILKEKEKLIYTFYFFELEMLVVLVQRLKDVCQLLSTRMKEGGCL